METRERHGKDGTISQTHRKLMEHIWEIYGTGVGIDVESQILGNSWEDAGKNGMSLATMGNFLGISLVNDAGFLGLPPVIHFRLGSSMK